MNTPWSLHSAGANPPTGSFGEPHSFVRTQAVDTGVPSGSSESPQWMKWLSLWSSITFITMAFSKKITQELLPEPKCLCETLPSL